MQAKDEKEEKIVSKCRKKYPEFTDQVDNLSSEQIEKNIYKYATYREETEMAKLKDEELNKVKALKAEYEAPYRDTINALKLKLAYLYILMEDKKEQYGDE